jgi:thiamine pyrophosphokinase
MVIRFPETVLLANGPFPTGEVPLEVLRRARRVICCDGAADRLIAAGRDPDWIVGDMDSLSRETLERLRGRASQEREQQTNDLSKAFRFCVRRGWRDIAILGSTGGREDHTLGNLSLLVDFAERAVVMAFADEVLFTPVLGSTIFSSFPRQQVSVFAFSQGTRVYAEGLRYPMDRVPFTRWWQATLNESVGNSFKLVFEGGPLLVSQTYGADA